MFSQELCKARIRSFLDSETGVILTISLPIKSQSCSIILRSGDWDGHWMVDMYRCSNHATVQRAVWAGNTNGWFLSLNMFSAESKRFCETIVRIHVVIECINGLNPKYLNDLFIVKKCKYNLRDDSVMTRNKVQTTNYGLKSFKDYGAKMWNVLPDCCKGDVSLDEFKVLIKSRNGPKCSCSVCLHFIWTGPYL